MHIHMCIYICTHIHMCAYLYTHTRVHICVRIHRIFFRLTFMDDDPFCGAFLICCASVSIQQVACVSSSGFVDGHDPQLGVVAVFEHAYFEAIWVQLASPTNVHGLGFMAFWTCGIDILQLSSILGSGLSGFKILVLSP